MDTGVAIFSTHDAIAPAEVARLAEERGHESLFFPEHTHIRPAGNRRGPAGWNREEMANHGTDPRRRMARVGAMKAIWTSDEASYPGEHVAFDRIWSWPKPAQRPHPPVLVGGSGPGVLDRVLSFGAAWFPNHAPEGILDRAAELRSRADRPMELMVMGVPADAKVLETYAAAGFRRAVHWLPPAPRGPVERALDLYEAAIAELNGE